MRILISFPISKGFDAWLDIQDELKPTMLELGIKMVWAGSDPEETKVYEIIDIDDQSVIKEYQE